MKYLAFTAVLLHLYPAYGSDAKETSKSVPAQSVASVEKNQPAAGAALLEPTQVIKRYTEELKSIAEIKNPVEKGKKNTSRETTIANKVRQFFDFEELAKQSLGPNWAKQTPKDRKKFSKLFIQLVENSYLSRSRNLVADYEVKYIGESIKDSKASVTSRVERRDANVDIIYDLHKKKNQWMIFNITLDNVNLIRNYQSQFNQIIKKKGFKHLIATMESKLDAPQEDVPL